MGACAALDVCNLRGRYGTFPARPACLLRRPQVPDYGTIIKDPIDISLIERRLGAQNYYLTLDIFIADWRRMFNNCR